MIKSVDIEISLSENGRRSFGSEGDSQEVGEIKALLVVQALVKHNVMVLDQIHAGAVHDLYERASSVYDSGVTCRAAASEEALGDVLTTLTRGYGDAAELVAWRCAELIHTGEDPGARIYLRREPRGDGPKFFYYVACVLRSDGTLEDPVAKLAGSKRRST